MTDLLADPLVNLALRAAWAAGELLRRGRAGGLHVETKTTPTDVVTQMDVAAEHLIVTTLLGERPDDGILGEEGGQRAGSSGVRWVVDPLDGTVNYLYDLPGWAVSIAAEVGGVVQAGVVDVPTRSETFVARRGEGAWLLERSAVPGEARSLAQLPARRILRGEAPSELSQALVATGFGYAVPRRTAQARALAQVLPAVRDIRRLGAAAVDLCHAAAGRVDCYYERGLQPWDHAAAMLIAHEAGLVVGGPFRAGGGWQAPGEDLAWAAPPELAPQFAALLAGSLADRD